MSGLQKDLKNSTIGNNKTETIAVDDTHSVKVDMASSIGASETLTVGGNQSVDIGSVLSENIGGSQVVVVGGTDTTNADSNYIEHVAAARSYSIAARSFTMQNGIEHTITGNLSRDVSAVSAHRLRRVDQRHEHRAETWTESARRGEGHSGQGQRGRDGHGLEEPDRGAAAEVHLIKGSYQATGDASVTRLIGALHQWKVGGDISIKGKMVTLLGATGTLTGGGSSIKLGGGPVVVTGSQRVTIEAPMIVKVGGTMKIGPG